MFISIKRPVLYLPPRLFPKPPDKLRVECRHWPPRRSPLGSHPRNISCTTHYTGIYTTITVEYNLYAGYIGLGTHYGTYMIFFIDIFLCTNYMLLIKAPLSHEKWLFVNIQNCGLHYKTTQSGDMRFKDAYYIFPFWLLVLFPIMHIILYA